jgi:hypothetical protein
MVSPGVCCFWTSTSWFKVLGKSCSMVHRATSRRTTIQRQGPPQKDTKGGSHPLGSIPFQHVLDVQSFKCLLRLLLLEFMFIEIRIYKRITRRNSKCPLVCQFEAVAVWQLSGNSWSTLIHRLLRSCSRHLVHKTNMGVSPTVDGRNPAPPWMVETL